MATTIYTYLHKDDLNGSRLVSMDGCMCKLYNIKREDSSFLENFNEDLKKPALYILLNKVSKKAYIGETDDFSKRIFQHLCKKKFWNEVLAFFGSNDDTLSKTEVQYLEFLAYNQASVVKSYDLSENTQNPKLPHMNVMQRGKTEKFFKHVQFLAKFIGCDIFVNRVHNTQKSTQTEPSKVVMPVDVKFTSEDLRGRIFLSLNGNGKYSKRELVLEIVKEFLKHNPNVTYSVLKDIFKRDYLGRFALYDFLESDIERVKKWKELGEDHYHYFLDDILVSGDGIQFVVCVEWDRTNIIPVLGIAKAMGWEIEILR